MILIPVYFAFAASDPASHNMQLMGNQHQHQHGHGPSVMLKHSTYLIKMMMEFQNLLGKDNKV